MPVRNDPTLAESESTSTRQKAASAGSASSSGPAGSDANQVKLPLIQDPNTEQKDIAVAPIHGA
jgi:hypothetical protein